MAWPLFCDSFQHYPPGQMSGKWTYIQGEPSEVGFGPGRTGLAWGSLPDFSLTGGFKTFATGYATMAIGAWLTFGSYPTGSVGGPIMAMQNQQYGDAFIAITGDGAGGLYVNLHDPADTGGDDFNYAIPIPGTYGVLDGYTSYFLELYGSVAIDAMAGTATYTVQVNVNGSVALASTTVTLEVGDPNWPNDPTFHNIWLGSAAIADDLYVTDGELLGNIRVVPLYPIADGSANQWTPNGLTPNFACVNPAVWTDPPTNYVDAPSTGVGDLDEYFLGGTFYTGEIKGAQFLWLLAKSDSGVGTVTSTLVHGATTEDVTYIDGLTTNAPSALSGIYAIAPYRQSPFTGSDWTMPEILATQQGMTRAS